MHVFNYSYIAAINGVAIMDKETLWELKKLSRFFEVGTTSWLQTVKVVE